MSISEVVYLLCRNYYNCSTDSSIDVSLQVGLYEVYNLIAVSTEYTHGGILVLYGYNHEFGTDSSHTDLL